jgi:internalin A
MNPLPDDNCSIIVRFEDPNLEAVIRNTINKSSGNIYLCDVEKIISLYGANMGITNLSGIEYLTSLQFLDLKDNYISDISSLSSLSSLIYLYIDNNSISDISPLIINKRINEGNYINIENNSINSDAINTQIPMLEARGVEVDY